MKVVQRVNKKVLGWATRRGYDAFSLVNTTYERVLLLRCTTPREMRTWGCTEEEPFVIINPDGRWIWSEPDPFKPKYTRKKVNGVWT